MLGFTDKYVEWLDRLYKHDLALSEHSQIKLLFIDWLFAVTQGLQTSAAKTICSVLLGSDVGKHVFDVSDINQSFILGYASHILEIDDSEFIGETHPSAVIISAAFAAASGSMNFNEFVGHLKNGYGSLLPVGRAMNPYHYELGWHGTGTVGIYGATSVCASIQGLSKEELRHALGISGTMASGIHASYGTQSKYINAANAARNGLMACRLARQKITGAQDVFEASGGVFQMFGSEAKMPEDPVLFPDLHNLNWIKPKPYRCCHCIVPVIECATQFKEELDCSQIVEMTLYLSEYSMAIVGQRAPKKAESAYFSASYCLAYALVSGGFSDMAFDSINLENPAMIELEQSINLVISSDLEKMDCRILIKTKDSPDLQLEQHFARGFEQVDRSVVQQRFLDQKSDTAKAQAKEIVEKVLGDEEFHLSELKNILRPMFGV